MLHGQITLLRRDRDRKWSGMGLLDSTCQYSVKTKYDIKIMIYNNFI